MEARVEAGGPFRRLSDTRGRDDDDGLGHGPSSRGVGRGRFWLCFNGRAKGIPQWIGYGM